VRGHSSTAAFVGRAAELAGLVDAYDRAAAGHGTVALVGGEAGVGKSRLVGEVSAHARRQGARILTGRCLDLEEGGLPYAPVVDMLRTLDRELSPDEGAATLGPGRAHARQRRGGAASVRRRRARGRARPAGRDPVDEALATPQGMGDPARSGLLHERRGRYLHRAGRHDDALAAYELAVALVPSRSHRGTRPSTAGA
jgi:hypothetical protein